MDSDQPGPDNLRNKIMRKLRKEAPEDWFPWNRRVRRVANRRMGIKTSKAETQRRRRSQLNELARQGQKEARNVGRAKRKREEQRERARQASG